MAKWHPVSVNRYVFPLDLKEEKMSTKTRTIRDIEMDLNHVPRASFSSHRRRQIGLWVCLALALILLASAAIVIPIIVVVTAITTTTASTTATTSTPAILPTGTPFNLNQTINGNTVTCSSVNNTNSAYTECSQLRQGGLYFPNGVGCIFQWSSSVSPHWDPVGFCRRVTGSSTANISVYYECDFTQLRTAWVANVWSTTNDIGFSRHLRCYY